MKSNSPASQQSSQAESDRAVAVVAAVCIKNAQTIERLISLLDGLDSHPSFGTQLIIRSRHHADCLVDQHFGIQLAYEPSAVTAAASIHKEWFQIVIRLSSVHLCLNGACTTCPVTLHDAWLCHQMLR